MDIKNKRLGKGLSALIGQPVVVEAAAVEMPREAASAGEMVGGTGKLSEPAGRELEGGGGNGGGGLVQLGVGEVVASPWQPRRTFGQDELAGLALSIKRQGVMQPLVVRRVPGVTGYQLVAGERRLRAAELAGLARVPAVVVQVSDAEAAAWALVENVQRVDLGPLEKADGYKRLETQFGMKHSEIAEALGESRSVVSNFIRLAELEEPVRIMLESEGLTFGHAKVLLGMGGGELRVQVAERLAVEGHSVRVAERMVSLVVGGMSVRDAERAAVADEMGERRVVEKKVRGVKGFVKAAPAGRLSGPGVARAEIADLERRLGDALGTRVRIHEQKKGAGTIEVQFFTHEQFEGLCERMGVVGGL